MKYEKMIKSKDFSFARCGQTRRVSDGICFFKHVFFIFLFLFVCGCGGYQSPPRETWNTYLTGASFGEMSTPAKIAKRPVFEDKGGIPLSVDMAPVYMDKLETEFENTLRKPGVQIQMVGQDILIVIVRDAFMEQNSAKISETGNDLLNALSKVLEKNNQTYVEISGYTDAMLDQRAATALSQDMSKRVAVYLTEHNIDSVRLFVLGRGSARPIAPQTDVGRLMNRRVEIRISPVIK